MLDYQPRVHHLIQILLEKYYPQAIASDILQCLQSLLGIGVVLCSCLLVPFSRQIHIPFGANANFVVVAQCKLGGSEPLASCLVCTRIGELLVLVKERRRPR